MTAPRPDLDALENTVGAMRLAGVSGVTISVDEADALIAAAREAREWRKHHCEQRITTPCPSCGHQSLFIAVGGHLTCSWLKCREPGPEAAFKAERQQREQAEQREARLRAALEDKEWRISVAKVAAERAYENQKVVAPLGVPQLLFAPIWGAISDAIDAALAEGQDG